MGTVAESTVLTIGDPCATPVTTQGILEDEGQCLETDHHTTPPVDSSSTDENIPKKNGSSSDKHRIRYTKDFIVECFQHPTCARKPIFELPNLSCILAVARFGATPFTTLYVPPRRKDENGRKEPEDNISLRPQSGNFSSGCAPNLSPSHYPQGQFSRFQFHHEDATKYPYDRGYSRNYRFNNNGRPEAERPERNRLERDRDDPRDRRDRDVDKREVRRDTRHPNQNRRQNSILWGPDSENQPEWTRRGGGKEGRGGRYGKDKYGGFRDHEEESEPSWFSEGPTSQHDTIELHGFQDDERRDREQHGLPSRESAQNRARGTSEQDANAESARISSNNNKAGEHPTSVSSSENKPTELELNLEKILTMDRISGFLPNGLFEESEQPAGSSRFSQIFHRNKSSAAPRSEPPPPLPPHEQHEEKSNRGSGGVSLQDLFGPKPEPNSSESKADVVKGMETQLRQILLGGKEMQEPPKEQAKQEDLNAFKKLLEDLVIKSNKTGPQKVENQPDNGSGRPFPGPPPGLQGIPFNPFALGSAPTQSRPPQPYNNIVPPMPMNQMAPSHPLSRLMEQQQQHQEAATMQMSQKRSGTPILAALTPTAVMRKMTADQQPKIGASVANPVTSSYSGIPAPASVQSAFSSSNNTSGGNVPRQQLNPLSSFVSAMAQNQSQHLAQPQALPPQVNHPGPGHRPPPHPGHLPVGSFPGYPPMHPQQRGPFPMVPNNGIPQPFNPYGVPFYNGPMQHRK